MSNNIRSDKAQYCVVILNSIPEIHLPLHTNCSCGLGHPIQTMETFNHRSRRVELSKNSCGVSHFTMQLHKSRLKPILSSTDSPCSGNSGLVVLHIILDGHLCVHYLGIRRRTVGSRSYPLLNSVHSSVDSPSLKVSGPCSISKTNPCPVSTVPSNSRS